jgi:hypothetical protein
VLLAALAEGGFQTRKAAAAQLAARWQPAGAFAPAAPASHRAQQLEALRRRWGEEHGAAAPEIASAPAPPVAEGTDDTALAPDLALVESLQSADRDGRRRAADEIAARTREQGLSMPALSRLAELMAAEPDPLVLRSVLLAVALDPREPGLALAASAASHPHGETRRLACEHLGRHGRPEHVGLVVPSIDDADPAVRHAAVVAAGHIGAEAAAPALEPLLAGPDRGLRVEAAAALARIGSPAGPAALERLACDADPRVRRRAATVMGELGQPRFAAALVGLLDDRTDVARAALDALPAVAGGDVAAQTGPAPQLPAERIAMWKAWWREQAATSPP